MPEGHVKSPRRGAMCRATAVCPGMQKRGERAPGDRIANIRKKILSWYRKNRRDLPWRKSKDPYRIWISEIMLQQTRVETVIPYYLRFLELFPDVRALAEAQPDRVLKAWENLGYYSRVRNLSKAAEIIVERHGEKSPRIRRTFRPFQESATTRWERS